MIKCNLYRKGGVFTESNILITQVKDWFKSNSSEDNIKLDVNVDIDGYRSLQVVYFSNNEDYQFFKLLFEDQLVIERIL